MEATKNLKHVEEIVFFIDQEKLTSEDKALTVRTLIEDFADQNPDETTLVRKDGDDLHLYEDLDELVELKPGMKFVIFHNDPLPVS